VAVAGGARIDRAQALALAGVMIGACGTTLLGRYLSWIGPLPALLLVGGSVLFVRSHLRADGTTRHDPPPDHDPGQHA
jgi:hypothetical protein